MMLLVSCDSKREIEWSVYHWKSSFEPSKNEVDFVQNQAVKKVYVRYFDVVRYQNKTRPVSTLKSFTPIPNVEVVPCIYITQSALKGMNDVERSQLADLMLKRIYDLNIRFNIKCREVLLDCDWTNSTRETYFSLLNSMKTEGGYQTVSTLRLHQLKDFENTGIPPADRCQLMLYNMGQLKSFQETNSILNLKEAAKYRRSIDEYPLPMDISIPLFSWLVRFRSGVSQEIISNFDRELLADTNLFVEEGGNQFRLKRDTFLFDHYQYKYDFYRLEESQNDDLLALIRQWEPYLPEGKLEVALYDLRPKNIQNRKETLDELEKMLQ